ncbi:hypothetical protein [Duganella qianjiadongensis]|uniref:Uncharacterized protein n=1 Tax=Duganella qianjiadongensis TaxID=2692176 RepID=A0ABW9VGX9_9BURK|nr:hypothetical protein [Duganella qianjiadongensis]MYM38397.1 hypothetical protein [Duganella qianjiadongensis]
MSTAQHYPQALLTWLDASPAAQLGERSIRMWQTISAVLQPIIGSAAMFTLLDRCQQLHQTAYPWLADSTSQQQQFAVLQQRLAEHSDEQALNANKILLLSFYEALTNMIGRPLLETCSMPPLASCRRAGPEPSHAASIAATSSAPAIRRQEQPARRARSRCPPNTGRSC